MARPTPKRPLNIGNNTSLDLTATFKNNESPSRIASACQTSKETERLQCYGLDIVNDDIKAEALLTDETSQFYATNKKRKLRNKALLPYKTETIRDQYKYLSHIIAHIYIAVKSLDLRGNLTISIEDLDAAKNAILNNGDQNAFINSECTTSIEGKKFETLHHSESEAIADDEYDGDSDYYSSEDEDDEDAENSTPIMKIEPESASIVTLKYWTKELRNLLKMGLVLPLDITEKLVRVFFDICLSRGQSIDILFYTEAISLLIRERKLLMKRGFTLDWELVYAEFATTLGNPVAFGPSMNDARMKKMISFALTVKPFFNSDCVPLIMDKIMSKCTTQTISASLVHLTVMLPMNFKQPKIEMDGSISYDKTDIRHYLPIFFNTWVNHKSDKEMNCLLTLIMNIAVENLKKGADDNAILSRSKYGIFTKEQYKFLMNQLFLSSQIRHKDNRMVKYCKTIAQLIINSLSTEYAFEDEGVIDLLKTYADSIFTMIHPSNSGPWSLILSDVVKKLAVSLHLRVQGEKQDRSLVPLYHPNYSGLPQKCKLNDKIVESIVQILLPLIHLGSQSKSSSHRRHYNEALQVLCFMKPNMVLDKLLLDWYSSFESVNSTHRIPIVITQLTQLSRIMVQLPVYRVHVPKLLSMLLPAIDSNDPEKTILATDFITNIAVVIPFANLADNEESDDGGLCAIDFTSQHLAYLETKFYEFSPASKQFGDQNIPEKFEYDIDFELIALKSASSSFKEFLVQLCDNCFKFLEVAPSIDSTNTIESQACALISYCFEALIESASDDLYGVLADKFFEYITNNVRHEVALVFCNISEAIVRRDPDNQLKRIMEFFMPHIADEINNGAGLSRSQEVLSKDQRLIWNMRILSGAISGAGSAILPYLSDIEKFIILKTGKLRGTAGLCAAMLASCALSTLSYLKPLERRLVSEKWLQENGGKYTEECWGAFQFQDTRFDAKYLDFKWYIPSSREVDVVVEHFENIATPSVCYINEMISLLSSTETMSLDEVDQLGFHIELLEGLLKGVCCLFDQSYTEPLENKKLGKLKTASTLPPLLSSPSLVNMVKSDSMSSLNIEAVKNTMNLHGNTFKSQDSEKSEKNDTEAAMMDDDTLNINPINREFDVKIERTDSSSNLSMSSIEVDSETPSGSNTPTLSDSIDAVDPTLTKRSNILYSYGPYYTNDPLSKAVDRSYQVLHGTRNEIGNSLHNLIKALNKRDGTIELTSKVIQCTSTWLNDCGYYSSDNELYTDNLHFISLLEFPGLFAPYTRTVLAARLAVYHCSRINISCCTRLPTKLDKILIKDLVSLAASPYSVTATHAASVLGLSLNRVVNCTSAIFNVFKDWEQAILNKDKEVLLNIMVMFDKKKLRGLVEKSSSMLPKYKELLFKSVELNEEDVTAMCMRLFKSIKKYVKIPGLLCILNEQAVECIRPPDSDIDFKIASLKLAKSKKKAILSRQLTNLISDSVNYLSRKLTWRFKVLVMELITAIQSNIEVPLQKDVLPTMLKYIDGSHPEVSKKGMFWIAAIVDVVESRAFNNYNLKNMLSVEPFDPSVVLFKDIVQQNTAEQFFKEIREVENPQFFIDNKQWVPVFPWNKSLKVVKMFNRSSYNFNDLDESAIREFSSNIKKEWLLSLLRTHIDESESTSTFFLGIVYFFNSITNLIIFGYIKNITLEDMFSIIDEIYKRDEKATHVATSEVICGILFACKNNKAAMDFADENISKRLESIFDNDLTQSTYKTWTVFSWWLPSHFDLRRTPKLLKLICDFAVNNDPKKSPFGLLSRLSFLKGYLGSTVNRFHDFDKLTHKMFSILAHPYDSVSKEVSAILFDILFFRSTDEIDDFDDYVSLSCKDRSRMGYIQHKKNVIFDEHFKLFLLKTLELSKENEGKSPQEVANSNFMFHVKGLTTLLFRILKTSMNADLVEYICPYILPLVIELDNVKEACNLAEINVDALFLILGSIRYREEDNDEIIKLLETNMGWKSPKLTQYKHVLAFFGVYGTVRFLERTPEQRKKLMEITCSMLFNQHLYLREQYSQNIKLFIHLFLDSEREEVIKSCIKKFKRIIKKNKPAKNTKLTTEQTNLVHGATLGLCALVEAYPYTTPPPKWLPEVLTILEVKCTSYNGVISKAAKDTLSQFKKTRQDTWHIDSKFFTEEQLEDLEGVLYKSYYL